MAISKRGKRSLICGGSSKVVSPRRVESPGSSGSVSPVEVRRRFGLFKRLRMFFSRLRARLDMRRRLRTHKNRSVAITCHQHKSIAKIPSLPVILETSEVREESSSTELGHTKASGKNLKAAFEELDSASYIGDEKTSHELVSSPATADNKSGENFLSADDWSSSAEGSSPDLFLESRADIENSVTDFNKCSSAVIKTCHKSTISGPSIRDKSQYDKRQRARKIQEPNIIHSSPCKVSSVETIDDVTDYPKSSSSDEVIKKNMTEKRDNRNRNMGRKSHRDNFKTGGRKQPDDMKDERKKKVNTRQVHFSQERIIIEPNASKRPDIADEYCIDKRAEEISDKPAWRRNEAVSSDSSNSSTDIPKVITRPKKERYLEAKVHPAVAKKSQSKAKTAMWTVPGIDTDASKCTENMKKSSDRTNPRITSKDIKAISLEPKEKNPYTLTSIDRTSSDDTRDNLKEIKSFAKDIVQQTTTSSLEIVEKFSAMKEEFYSPRPTCFSLFDDEEDKSSKTLVKEIISEAVRKDISAVRQPQGHNERSALSSESGDDSFHITETRRSKSLRKKPASCQHGSDDSVHTMEYEPTDDSDMDVEDLPFDYIDSKEKINGLHENMKYAREPSGFSGWEQEEDLAKSLSAYTASISGSEQLSVYSKSTGQVQPQKPMSGRIIIHDPKQINRKPIRYPVPEPKESTLPPNPFPVNKQSLPNVGNPKKDKSEGHYSKSKKKKKSVRNPLLADVKDEGPMYVESTSELGLLKEVTNRWEPTPGVFLGKTVQHQEHGYLKKKIDEPLAPIAGSRTSPVSNEVLFPNRVREYYKPTYVYTHPIGKLHSHGRDASGIDISCFTNASTETSDEKKTNRNCKQDTKNIEQHTGVSAEHMAQYKKMEVIFRARNVEVPDARFWVDLNKGKFEEDMTEFTSKESKKRQPKTAWEVSKPTAKLSSDNSSKDQLPEELATGSKPLAPIGSKESSKVSYETEKENFKFFKKTAAADSKDEQRKKDVQTDMKVLKSFHQSQKPLSPIENVSPEEKASATENMYFFRHVVTNPGFWSDNVIPKEKKPKQYIPKVPLNSIQTKSTELDASPAENMEFFRSVAKYPQHFYEVPDDEEPEVPKERPYFLEAPVGSTKDNAGRRHSNEDENLAFFKHVSNNPQFYKRSNEVDQRLQKSCAYSLEENHYIDSIEAEDNLRFFQNVSKNPSSFYKTKAREEAKTQIPKRKQSQSCIPDDPANYVDTETAKENMEFFKNHAKKSSKSKKKHT